MLALHIVPDCLISGIIGYVEVAETYKLQMQILIPTRLPPSGLKEGHLSFEIVIEEHSNFHGLTATREVFWSTSGVGMRPVPLAACAGGKANVRGTAFRNGLGVLRSAVQLRHTRSRPLLCVW
jgi:hypothetical protein